MRIELENEKQSIHKKELNVKKSVSNEEELTLKNFFEKQQNIIKKFSKIILKLI